MSRTTVARSTITRTVLSVAFMISSVVACGPISSGQQGVTCDANSDCGSGLQCLSESLADEGGCTSIGKVCLTLCTSDSDCTNALGPGYTCSSGPCGASVPTCQVPTTAPSDGGIQDAPNDGPSSDGPSSDGTSSGNGNAEGSGPAAPDATE